MENEQPKRELTMPISDAIMYHCMMKIRIYMEEKAPTTKEREYNEMVLKLYKAADNAAFKRLADENYQFKTTKDLIKKRNRYAIEWLRALNI